MVDKCDLVLFTNFLKVRRGIVIATLILKIDHVIFKVSLNFKSDQFWKQTVKLKRQVSCKILLLAVLRYTI